MTSYQFEVVAKNAVIDLWKKHFDMDLKINEINFVWFAHELGFKKCTLYGPKMGAYYAEVTYNRDKDELYVDIYYKVCNKTIPKNEFNYEVNYETA